jgi:uncharacterized membrane protein
VRWSRLIAVPFLVLILVIFSRQPIEVSSALMILVAWIAWYLPLYRFYRSLNYGDVWVLWPLGSTAVGITIILSVVFLGEVVSGTALVGIVALFLWIFLVGVDFKSLGRGLHLKAVLYVSGAILGRGLMYFFFKIAIDASSPMRTMVLIESWVLFWSLIHEYGIHKKIPPFTKNKQVRIWLLAMVLVANIGGIAYNYGLQLWPVSVVSAIFAWSPLITALYGMIVYKEKLSNRQWTGIWILVCGLVLVSWVI